MRELSSHLAGSIGSLWLYYAFLLADARGNLAALKSLEPPLPSWQPSRHRLNAVIPFAWGYAKIERLEAARRALASVPAFVLARMPVLHGDLGLLSMLAEIYEALGDLPRAELLHAQLTPHAALNAVGPFGEYRGSVAHYVGVLAALLGRESEASERFAFAEQVNHKLGMPHQLARTRACRERLAAQKPSRPTSGP